MQREERERVVITGIGLVTPVGIGTADAWRALLAGQNGIGSITQFDCSTFRVRIAGEVKSWEPTRWIDKKKLKEMDRFTEFALGAAALAVGDAKLELSEAERARTR
jgi:3-oxoacyl-[acyl-carrier-protein] synthase II